LWHGYPPKPARIYGASPVLCRNEAWLGCVVAKLGCSSASATSITLKK
jgi:hypothetical protein